MITMLIIMIVVKIIKFIIILLMLIFTFVILEKHFPLQVKYHTTFYTPNK